MLLALRTSRLQGGQVGVVIKRYLLKVRDILLTKQALN